MKWFEYTEDKRKLLITGIVILCVAMLAVTARRNFVAFDSFWHLQAGLDWLNNGLSPWIDHFSFTYAGEAIYRPPFLFQGLLAILVSAFGLEPGFQVYRFASYIIIIIIFSIFLRQLQAKTIIYLLVLPMIIALVQLRTMVRPELISYGFSIAAIILYYRARDEMTVANMLPMVGLMWIWSNYHSPIFGYIIFFGYFVDIAILQLRNKERLKSWLIWCAWGGSIVLVGFITPYFQHALVGLYAFSPEWKDLIQEYAPAYIVYRNSWTAYLLIVISAITFCLLIWKRKIGLLIVCSILFINAVFMARLVTPSGLVILSVLAWMMSEIDLQQQIQKMNKTLQILVGLLFFSIIALAIFIGVYSARNFMEENKMTVIRFPINTIEYMRDNNISGRIFNNYEMGGYLIHKLAGDSTVYIDGRTDILYPHEFFTHHSNLMKSISPLQADIEKYNIDLAFLVNNHYIYTLMANTKEMHLDYVGAKYSLYKKDKPNFPGFGQLLAYPACWDAGFIDILQAESDNANKVLPIYSPLLPFINSIVEYSNASNQLDYLTSQTELIEKSDFELRFTGYQALRLGQYLLSLEHFNHIKQGVLQDFLARAIANIHLGRWSIAESVLDNAIETKWTTISQNERVLMYKIAEQIRQHGKLNLLDEEFIDQLARRAGIKEEPATITIPDYYSFCPELPSAMRHKMVSGE